MAEGNGRPSLTDKQQKALDVLKGGGGPTQIAKALGIKSGAAASHIAALKKKGYLNAKGEVANMDAEFDRIVPPPANGAVFDADSKISALIEAQGAHLRETRERIDETIIAHKKAIEANTAQIEALRQENAEHTNSIETLDEQHQHVEAALGNLSTA